MMSMGIARRLDVFPARRPEPLAHGYAAQADPFQLEIIETRARFDAIASDWNDLFERAGLAAQAFQTHRFLSCWADRYLVDDCKLAIVAAWREGRLAMVWPLVRKSRIGLKRLIWMGEPAVQFGDVLVEDGAITLELLLTGWNTVRGMNVDVIHLRKVRADSRIAPILARAQLAVLLTEGAPFLELSSAPVWSEYEKRYSAKARSARRRLARRLAETGCISFDHCPAGPLASALALEAIGFKRRRFLQQGWVAPTVEDARFEALVSDLAALPGSRLSVIRRDGAAIGIEFSLTCKDQAFGYIIAHDPDFEKLSVGILLAEFTLRSAHAQGITRFDLLAPPDAYKMDWADGTVGVDDLGLGLTPLGRLYMRIWAKDGRARVKRLMRKMPRWLTNTLANAYARMKG